MEYFLDSALTGAFKYPSYITGLLITIKLLTGAYQELVLFGVITTSCSSANDTVTVQNPGSGDKLYFDVGAGAQLSPSFTPVKNRQYRFDVSSATMSGSTLRFSTTADGTHGGGSEYTRGIADWGANIKLDKQLVILCPRGRNRFVSI